MTGRAIFSLAIVVLVIAGVALLIMNYPRERSAPRQVALVHYACNDSKSIDAIYFEASSTPPAQPGQPPKPGGSVALQLSDGRTITLPQTISGSGIRYANSDESIIFWSKGETAFVMEHTAQTYNDCHETVSR